MKRRMSAMTLALILIAGFAVAAQDAGRGAPPPKTITTIKVERMPVKTVKTEVPIAQPVRRDTAEFRGEGYFFQRCSVCHLGEWRKAGQIPAYGPVLKGVLKDRAKESTVRAYIQNGSANMPGFQHTFTPAQFEDLIAYLKTL